MLAKKLLFLRLVLYSIRTYLDVINRALITSIKRRYYNLRFGKPSSEPSAEDAKEKNIIIVGASFAGYFAAKIIATSLPPNSGCRVVVIEPHSHFNFTWVFPRFCVVKDHEHKAFIPYGRYIPAELVRWVQARVQTVESTQVRLTNGSSIPYDFLLVATGSGASDGLPSRAGVNEKNDGVVLLREMQNRIESSEHLVVVGGGAAGVELAADAKALYPQKNVVLVHSREAVMNRFGLELQVAALDGLRGLGVEVILGERLVKENVDDKTAILSSGRELRCDVLVSLSINSANCLSCKGCTDSFIRFTVEDKSHPQASYLTSLPPQSSPQGISASNRPFKY